MLYTDPEKFSRLKDGPDSGFRGGEMGFVAPGAMERFRNQPPEEERVVNPPPERLPPSIPLPEPPAALKMLRQAKSIIVRYRPNSHGIFHCLSVIHPICNSRKLCLLLCSSTYQRLNCFKQHIYISLHSMQFWMLKWYWFSVKIHPLRTQIYQTLNRWGNARKM